MAFLRNAALTSLVVVLLAIYVCPRFPKTASNQGTKTMVGLFFKFQDLVTYVGEHIGLDPVQIANSFSNIIFLLDRPVADVNPTMRITLEKWCERQKRSCYQSSDSAGGNLVAAVSLNISLDANFPKTVIKFMSLDYPFLQAVDLRLPSYRKYENGPCFLDKLRMMKCMLRFTIFSTITNNKAI
ncbi:hypothetical protein DPMN_008089 [Dreissena polymorpha]|nr:hypothetical protein DPMN_008089 [Dreissena polymorpha]